MTPYRSEIDALRERKESLEREIARLREQTTELDSLRAREGEVAAELAGIEARLSAGGAARRALPMLDQVRVASPCSESWDEMLGDGSVRHCLKCDKNVYNLSAMSRDQAAALLQERLGGELCVRFYQRADGTLLTQDCPVGVSRKRNRRLALAVAGAGAMALAAASMIHKNVGRTMGMMAPVAHQGEPTVEPMGEVVGEVKMGDVATPPLMGSAVYVPPPPSAEPKTPPPHVVMGRPVSPVKAGKRPAL